MLLEKNSYSIQRSDNLKAIKGEIDDLKLMIFIFSRINSKKSKSAVHFVNKCIFESWKIWSSTLLKYNILILLYLEGILKHTDSDHPHYCNLILAKEVLFQFKIRFLDILLSSKNKHLSLLWVKTCICFVLINQNFLKVPNVFKPSIKRLCLFNFSYQYNLQSNVLSLPGCHFYLF